MHIQCGAPSSKYNNCVLVNGDTVVSIEDYASSNFPVTTVHLDGLTFAGFRNAAIAGNANADTTVELSNILFTVRGPS